jgi:hypothetical protein
VQREPLAQLERLAQPDHLGQRVTLEQPAQVQLARLVPQEQAFLLVQHQIQMVDLQMLV